jgi:hypothetical protein
MKDWIMAVCPEIAEWQAEVIAVQVRISVEAEREACAQLAESPIHRHEIAEKIRARGQE